MNESSSRMNRDNKVNIFFRRQGDAGIGPSTLEGEVTARACGRAATPRTAHFPSASLRVACAGPCESPARRTRRTARAPPTRARRRGAVDVPGINRRRRGSNPPWRVTRDGVLFSRRRRARRRRRNPRRSFAGRRRSGAPRVSWWCDPPSASENESSSLTTDAGLEPSTLTSDSRRRSTASSRRFASRIALSARVSDHPMAVLASG